MGYMDELGLKFRKRSNGETTETVVTNRVCSKCGGEISLRGGYSYYPKEKLLLCAKCDGTDKKNEKPKVPTRGYYPRENWEVAGGYTREIIPNKKRGRDEMICIGFKLLKMDEL